MIVNSFGNRDDTRRTTRTDPIQGRQLRLTLDLGLQRTAQNAVARAIEAAQGNGNPADAGAFVAMDPRDGEVLALGSYPSFDANLFAKPIDQATYEQLNSEENGAPLFNRAIAAGYPTASTFKPITALAAVDAGIITPSTPLSDPGVFRYGGREFRTPSDAVYGTLALPRALQVSSDVFFYQLGAAANERGPVIQEWARKLSFDKPTGIDLPGEYGGLVPGRRSGATPSTRSTSSAPRRRRSPIGTTEALYACGGVERGWSGGDNVNLSVGQGDLQATPLQLATAYAAIANGGKVVTPHLGQQIEDGAGRQLEEIRKPAKRRVDIDPTHARGDPQRPARRRRARTAARRPTSSPASPTPSTARPAPPSARRTRTSPGTPRTSTTRSSRSSSWSRSRRAASAPRPPRRRRG